MNLMTVKIIFLALLSTICINAYSADKDSPGMHALKLYLAEDIAGLKTCSEAGNQHCSGVLGLHYYAKGDYVLARPLLLKGSQMGMSYCDFTLGLLYSEGKGVLQSDDKAINFYKRAAKLGNATAAYNISTIYLNNSIPLSYRFTQDEMTKYKYNVTNAYAWEKIALALGEKMVLKENGQELPLLDDLNLIKQKLLERGYLNEADKIASDICSTIPECAQ